MNVAPGRPTRRLRSRRARLVAVSVALVAALAVGCGVLPQLIPKPADESLRPDDRAVVARGEALYHAHCASCHGERLQGQPMWRQRDATGLLPAPPHDASGHTWHHPDALLVRMTRLGVGPAAGLTDYRSAMPAFEGILTSAQIVEVLSWIKAQWPPEIRARHDEINRLAAERR